MNEQDRGGKIDSRDIDKDKLAEVIMNVFTEEELTLATQHKLFSLAPGELGKLVAPGSNLELAEAATKVLFVMGVAYSPYLPKH